MRTITASTLILVAICLGLFAAAPANLRTSRVATTSNSRETVHNGGAPSGLGNPRSPIRHLIVVVGENRSVDNVFGTYVPSNPTQTVWNLLSQDIVQINGMEVEVATIVCAQPE